VDATVSSKTAADTGFFSDGVVTVNRANNHVFYIYSNYFEGIPNQLVEIDGAGAHIADYQLNMPASFNISGIHYNLGAGSMDIIAFGIVQDAAGYHYSAGSFAMASSSSLTYQQRFFTGPVAPYVDFTWSDFDATGQILYVLSRHEDEPTTLEAQIWTFNFKTSQSSFATASLEQIYSVFFADSNQPGILYAFSPGPVNNATGDVIKTQWNVISVEAISGKVATYLPAPADVNQYRVFWGGGVHGFCNSKASPSTDSTNLHFLSMSGPGYPNPPQLLGMAFNLTAKAFTELKAIPYLHNLVMVG